MGKAKEKQIIKQRMDELFDLALQDERDSNSTKLDRKYQLIYQYSQKYKVPLAQQMKLWTCRKCRTGIYANGGHIRINNSRITVHCGKCGYIRRYLIRR